MPAVRILYCLLFFGVLIWTAGCDNVEESDPPSSSTELRGVWLTNVDSEVLDSSEAIDEAMTFLADHHFNVVFPVVWNDGTTVYPSAVMDSLFDVPINPRYEGRDPLAEVIDAAEKQGLAVVPWFEFGFAARHNDATPSRILEARPGWAARDTSGAVLQKNDFYWMNAYHPEVQDFLATLVHEVVTTYDIDGIQGDDRLPAQPVEGGYSDETIRQYRAAHNGADPPDNPHNNDWKAWRADHLNAFAARIYRETKAVSPTLQVSWSPSIYPWGYDEYLQEWPAWLRAGHADWVHPQVYRRDTTAYRETLETQLSAMRDAAAKASLVSAHADPSSTNQRPLYPGVLLNVGDYFAEADEVVEAVRTNRALGINGEVFFFYEGLRADDNARAEALRSTVYRDPAAPPIE